MKPAIILLFTFFLTSLYSQESINRLLNLQYISKEFGIKELTRQKTIDELDKAILHSISAGDILYDVSSGKKFLFIVDNEWDRIVYLKKDANYVRSFGENGSGNGQFYNPQDLTILNDGTMYVADNYNERIVQLQFNFSTEQISFVKNISISPWKPRSVGVSPDNVGPLFVGTEENKLLVLFWKTAIFKYPDDFGDSIYPNALENNGGYEVDVDDYYVYFMDNKNNKIYVLSYNSNASYPDHLFTNTWDYSFTGSYSKILKMTVHQSWPDNCAYLLFSDSKMRIKVMSSGDEQPLMIPGVENKTNGEFYNVQAIGMEPDLGDLFIGERWRPLNSDPDWKAYWYALGPEIQNLNQQTLDYQNENKFTFNIAEESKLTTKIIKWDESIITQLTATNEIFKAGEITQFFNEYFNNEYLPYGTYKYEITAKSAYPKEGDSDPSNPQAILYKSFTGGVNPSSQDIVCSSNYIVQGNTYTVYSHGNSADFNPEPIFSDTWRIVSTTHNGDANIADITENGSPYKARYRASHWDNNLSKTNDVVHQDQIGARLGFKGIWTSENISTFTVHEEPPGGCPILYVNETPIANLLPTSEQNNGNQTDRIVLPKEYLQGEEINLKIKESNDDISRFVSIELVVEDVEKGTTLNVSSSGVRILNTKDSRLNINYSELSKNGVIPAGTRFNFSLNFKGDALLGIDGHVVEAQEEPEDPIKMQSVSLYEERSDSSIFIDALPTRTVRYEDKFFISDSINSPHRRDFSLLFLQDYSLKSINLYSSAENALMKKITTEYFPKKGYTLQPEILENESLNKTNTSNEMHILKPAGELTLKYKFKPLKHGYERFAYLRVTGRYDEYNSPDLAESTATPKHYKLYQNYPNPFNPSTNITFGLPQQANVTLTIFNSIGQVVYEVYRSYPELGFYKIDWHGKNLSGLRVSSGIYFYRVNITDSSNKQVYSKTKKMLIIK